MIQRHNSQTFMSLTMMKGTLNVHLTDIIPHPCVQCSVEDSWGHPSISPTLHLEPITSQSPGHRINLDQSEASISFPPSLSKHKILCEIIRSNVCPWYQHVSDSGFLQFDILVSIEDQVLVSQRNLEVE